LTKTGKFKLWLNRKVFEIDQKETLEEIVENKINPENLKIEVKDEHGEWKIL